MAPALLLVLATAIVTGTAVWVLSCRFAPAQPPFEQPPATEAPQPDLFRSILLAMPEGIVLFEADGSTAFANDASVDLLGGRPASASLVAPVDLREALTDPSPPRQIEIDTGSPPRTLQARIVPTGEAGEMLLVLRDLTEARRAERVRTDFVANASHELKTPAASIQVIAETIRAAADDPEALKAFTGRLEEESLRLARIVADLLDLSRLESSDATMVTLDLAGIAIDEAERIRPDAQTAGLTLTTEAAAPVQVLGDERDLRLLVRNLLDNAVRYTPAGGSIALSVDTRADARLRVADTGRGIPARDGSRIFERFYRVDRARARDTGGTGLGLSIVKHIAETHGGSVGVESELGVGSTFTVTLPMAHPDDRTP